MNLLSIYKASIATKTFNLVAQSAHLFSSIAIMYICYYTIHWNPYIACGSVILASFLKEKVIDPLVETVDVQGKWYEDFGVQSIGAVVALLLILYIK